MTRPEFVRQVKSGETVLPGRGLPDRAFRLPETAPEVGGPPEHPSIHPAGGEWPYDELDVPPSEGPPPHPREIVEPMAPGTSVISEHEEEDEE